MSSDGLGARQAVALAEPHPTRGSSRKRKVDDAYHATDSKSHRSSHPPQSESKRRKASSKVSNAENIGKRTQAQVKSKKAVPKGNAELIDLTADDEPELPVISKGKHKKKTYNDDGEEKRLKR